MGGVRLFRLFPPGGEVLPDAAKILRTHFNQHSLVQGIHFLLSRDSHFEEKWLDQLEACHAILIPALVRFGPGGELQGMSPIPHVDTPCLAQEVPQEWSDAERRPVRRKASPGDVKGAWDPSFEPLVRGAGSRPHVIACGQANDSPGARN